MNFSPVIDSTPLVLPPVAGAATLSDSQLMGLIHDYGDARRRVDAGAAVLARELAVRSERALGHQGLAARHGLSSSDKLVQKLTGVSFADARSLATAGAVLDAVHEGRSAWLAPVAEALAVGTLSVAGASAIATGLGEPSASISADELLDAAHSLVAHADTSTPEDTSRAARAIRAQLDVESVADIEAHRRAQRSAKWYVRADGMTKVDLLLDPESAAVVVGGITTPISPRRGGPRFVDESEQDRSAVLMADGRTNEQLAVDALVEIVKLASRAAGTSIDDTQQFGSAGVFGIKSPAVRVHVQAEDLRAGTGFAHFEGQAGLVSIETAERHICELGILPILFDGNRPIDVGRTKRLHDSRQRAAIAAFWNGCAWDCERPPQYTEVHHIEAFDGSNTTLANGISLCRFHHMELHANKWKIRVRRDGTYWLIPPPTLDAAQSPIELRPKSPLKHQLSTPQR